MILLVSGSTRTVARLATVWPASLGHMLTPANRNSPEALLATGLPWCADNGCFGGLDEAAYRRMLRRVAGLPRCLFVVVPDVVADARGTLALWRRWRDEVALAGHPLAFVGQDGAEDLEVPWPEMGAWFVGGSTRWKLSAASEDLCREASRQGKWVHMGRVNSLRRMRDAHAMGCDSIDGSSASMFGDKYIHKYCQWLAPGRAPDAAGGGPGGRKGRAVSDDWEKVRVDVSGRECREALAGTVECLKCGKDVELVAETEEWVRADDGTWRHSRYGGAMGVCCGLLYAEQPDGRLHSYRLEGGGR